MGPGLLAPRLPRGSSSCWSGPLTPPSSSPEARPPPDPRSRPSWGRGHTAQWAASCPAPSSRAFPRPPMAPGLLGLSLPYPPPPPRPLGSVWPPRGLEEFTLWNGEEREEVVRGGGGGGPRWKWRESGPPGVRLQAGFLKQNPALGGERRVHCSRGPLLSRSADSQRDEDPPPRLEEKPTPTTLPLLPLGGGPALGLSSVSELSLSPRLAGEAGPEDPRAGCVWQQTVAEQQPRAWTTLLLACGVSGPPGGPSAPQGS